VFCPVDTGAKSLKLGEDRVGAGGPDEGSTGLVVVGDEGVDLGDQVAHRAERAAADRLGADVGEEALDQVEPRAVGGDEVQVPARPGREPGLDLGMLVRGVVVEDDVDLEVGGHRVVDGTQQAEGCR
jgi:hypothetical protein